MIRLGGFEWRHTAWQDGFYPPDLPQEWRLTFYANEFDALGLQPQAWLTPPLDELALWVEDTREGFRFYLELPTENVAGLGARLQVLAPRLGAALAAPACPPEIIAQAQAFAPVWAHTVIQGLPRLAHDFAEALEPERAPLLVLESSQLDWRAARKAMDTLGPREGIILLRDAGSALAALQGLRTLRNLMGWQ